MKQYSIHCEWEHKMNEYKINEIFIHTDGKAYQCVEGETCEGCAFRCTGNDCGGPYCDGRSDGRSVKFIAVTEPVEGMLYRAKNGRMYRRMKGSHWDHQCACDDDNSLSCAALDTTIFGGFLLRGYWAPIAEDTPAPAEPSKPVEPPKPTEPTKRPIEDAQATRIAELEAERDRLRGALVKLRECLEGYFGKTEKDFFEDCNEDSGELYFADVYNVAINTLKKAGGEE